MDFGHRSPDFGTGFDEVVLEDGADFIGVVVEFVLIEFVVGLRRGRRGNPRGRGGLQVSNPLCARDRAARSARRACLWWNGRGWRLCRCRECRAGERCWRRAGGSCSGYRASKICPSRSGRGRFRGSLLGDERQASHRGDEQSEKADLRIGSSTVRTERRQIYSSKGPGIYGRINKMSDWTRPGTPT